MIRAIFRRCLSVVGRVALWIASYMFDLRCEFVVRVKLEQVSIHAFLEA